MARLAAAVVTAMLVAGCGSTRTVTRTVTVTAPPQLGGGVDETFYGRVVSASAAPGGYYVRFDPAWWLSGVAASVALAHAQHRTCATPACKEIPVPDDYYVLDEGHQTLTFFLPRAAHGTVLSRPLRFPGARITADRLVRLLREGPRANLFEPLESGLWLRTRGGTVESFAQQYRP